MKSIALDKLSKHSLKVRKLFFLGFLTFSVWACKRPSLVYVQPYRSESFARKTKVISPTQKLQTDSFSLLKPLLPSVDTIQLKLPLVASTKTAFPPTKKITLHQVVGIPFALQKEKPKPTFFKEFSEKLKNWHPFRRKHRFTRKMTIGLVLLGIAIALELLIHVQTLTIIFGVAALIYIIQGMKRLF